MARLPIPQGLRRRAPLTATLAAGGMVGALLATLAFVSPGYTTQTIEPDDASVWVANGAKQMVGLANAELATLSTATATTASTPEILQGPGWMLVHDPAGNTIDIVDPAEVATIATVPLPQGSPKVVAAGERLMVYRPDTGDAWVTGIHDLATFDKESAPTLRLGVNAVLAADETGRYVGYSAMSTRVVTSALDSGTPVERDIAFKNPGTAAQATLVGGMPVVYDPHSGQVWVDGKLYSVAKAVTSPDTAVLMTPTLTGDSVLIAFDGGLVSMNLGDGLVTDLGHHAGHPAAPVRLGACAYAAWGSGDAFRDCGRPATFPLAGAHGTRPVIATNGRTVVASEPESGLAWTVQDAAKQINNWGDFAEATPTVVEDAVKTDAPPNPDVDQKPPVAVDDDLGVRAGRSNTLSVLVNDSDPNADAIVITDVGRIDPAFGALVRIRDDQALQVTTTPGATGSTQFQYTIDDGHGNTATAAVTLTVHPPGANTPPVQVRPTRTSVASANSTEIDVLGDWIDPESDPIYLRNATTAAPDTVTFSPEGKVTFADAGGPGSPKAVALAVSDGNLDGSGTLNVTVNVVGTNPVIAENFAVRGTTGQEVTVKPLAAVRGGTGKISLNAATKVGSDTPITVTPDYAAGTFTVVATQPGTYFVEYSATDSTLTGTGVVRLDIHQPPGEQLAPVTVPTTAFLSLRNTQLVDVLATDYDPAGGVLSITGVNGAGPPSGIMIEILEQRILRVTLSNSLTAPATVSYTVTNGHLSATGTLTLVEVPEPATYQPPVAENDSVSARVGSLIDIPVLDNDHQPNGKPLLLNPQLDKPLEGADGTLVVSGNKLRYLAPSIPGVYTAVYRISSTDQQWATATVTISVHEADAANNLPPKPATITTRVGAGQKVTIPIPLGSIDADGDLVSLIGPASQPRLGAITAVGDSSIEYSAAKYSGGGTDTFTYTVKDALGATGIGTIRVGIVPDAGQSAPPVAMDDPILTRPGTRLTINVLANDSDPANSPLTIIGAEASDASIKPEPTASTIRVTAPTTPGIYAVRYTIANASGLRSRAWLYLQVDPHASLIAPQARDVTLTLEQIAGRSTVDADVLAGVTFSEGSLSDLLVHLPNADDSARVTATKAVNVDVQASSRIVPFTVARADDPAVSSTAFLMVPGSEDASPQVRIGIPTLTVVSGQTLNIPINNYVIAAGGKRVTLTDLGTIAATRTATGSPLWANDATLTYTPDPDFWGPASITFTVTDGTNRAILNFPITVTPAKDQPASVRSAPVPLEAGAETTLDLTGLTDFPGDLTTLTYAVENSNKAVVTASLSGAQLTIRASDGASAGATASLVVSVHGTTQPGKSGTITVSIVKSTRPTVVTVPDLLTIRRGDWETVDVLANDSATNPFPGKPLRVIEVGGKPPAGITVSTSADKRQVTVAVGANAPTGAVTLTYRVADATADPDRYVTGTITVRIQDIPDAPAGAPRITKDPENAAVTLAIPHANANFSEITEYVVTSPNGSVVKRCTNPDACRIDSLTYAQSYQFSAYAVNAIGEGPSSPMSATVVLDLAPPAPVSVSLTPTNADPAGHSMLVQWSNPGQTTPGSNREGFEIALTGPGVSLTLTAPAEATSLALNDPAITPGSSYTVTVKAKNKTFASDPGTSSAVAVGPPRIGAAYARGMADGSVTVAIEGGNGGGGNAAYAVSQAGTTSVAADSTCDPTAFTANIPAGGTTWSGDSYRAAATYTVQVSNGLFCRAYPSTALPTLPAVTGGRTVLPSETDPNQVLSISGLASNTPTPRFEYRLVVDGAQLGDWTDYPGAGAIDRPELYGRAVTVYARACFGSIDLTCGPEQAIGTVTPLHMQPTGLACTVGGRLPTTADQPAPGNNGLTLTIEVRYTEVVAGSSQRITEPNFHPIGNLPPSIAPGNTLEAQWRTSTAGRSYIVPNATTCAP